MLVKSTSAVVLMLIFASNVAVSAIQLKIESLDSIAQSDVDSWQMFHHDSGHTGYSKSTALDMNVTAWISAVGSILWSSPAIANGKVYTGMDGSIDGNTFVALNESTGDFLWGQGIGQTWQSPAVAYGKVFIGRTGGGPFYAFDKDNGTVIWSRSGFGSKCSPTVADGKVFTGSYDETGMVWALNESTGDTIWNRTTEGYIDGSAAYADGRIFIGSAGTSRNSKVHAFDANTGNEIWSYMVGDTVHSSPTVSDGKVFVTIYNIGLHVFDASNGTLLWTYPIGMGVYSSPAVAYGKVFVGGSQGVVYALNETNGNLIWAYTIEPHDVWGMGSSPAVADGKVFIGSQYDNKVYAFNESTGSVIWSYLTGGAIWSSPAIANGKVFVGSFDGKVYAFGPTHDVAVTNVASDRTVVGQGRDVTVEVTTENQGSFTETFDVAAYVNATQIAKETILDLDPSGIRVLNFTWNTTDYDIGNYTIVATADVVENETDTLDNTYSDGVVEVRLPIHDVAVTDVRTSKSGCWPIPTVGEGYTVQVNVTTENQGDFSETFNIYLNESVSPTPLSVTLSSGDHVTFTIVWNTSGLAKGNWTLIAFAEIVQNETDTEDNTFEECWLVITVPGDLNGDFIVDIFDAILLSNAFNSQPFSLNWNVNTDINNDNLVDIFDAIILANHYSQHYP